MADLNLRRKGFRVLSDLVTAAANSRAVGAISIPAAGYIADITAVSRDSGAALVKIALKGAENLTDGLVNLENFDPANPTRMRPPYGHPVDPGQVEIEVEDLSGSENEVDMSIMWVATDGDPSALKAIW